MKIAVFGKKITTEFFPYFKLMCDKFRQYGTDIMLYRELFENVSHDFNYHFDQHRQFSQHTDLDGDVDFLISIGGDGTFLESVSFVRKKSIPIIGINSGRLGFLATISRENIAESIDAIFNRQFTLEKRSLIELESPEGDLQEFPFALNEFAIQKKGTGMISIEVTLADKHLNTYWADGLIISTPTGSTGYSMSVGGPIVTPGSKNFILSPIAPHNLTVRPMVIPDHHELTMTVFSRQGTFWVSMDSRSVVYTGKVSLKVKKAGFFIHLLKLEKEDYFETLRSKLMWGADKRI